MRPSHLPGREAAAFRAARLSTPTLRRAALLPLLASGLAATAGAQTVDGTIVGDTYPRLAVQTCNTGFGDNANELDGAYARISGGKLYLALTGNLSGSGVDKLEIFLDVRSGGQNTLDGTLTMDGVNTMSGLTFDSGFEADYLIVCRQNSSLSRFDLDIGELGTTNFDSFPDVFSGSTEGAAVAATIASPSILSSGLDVAFDNSNTAGVNGSQGTAATRADAAAVQTGVELGITLADLGYTSGDIRVCAFINNQSHTFVSNQVLGGLPGNYGNMGWPGTLNFSSHAGDQFFSVVSTSNGFDTYETVATSFPGAELVEFGDLDGNFYPDAVAYSSSTGDIVYFSNTFDIDGGWAAPVTIANLPGATDLQVFDGDNDGDLDIAAISPTERKLIYVENTAGPAAFSFSFAAATTVADMNSSEPLVEPRAFVADDFDNDGVVDDIVIGDRYLLLYLEAFGAPVQFGLANLTTLDVGIVGIDSGDFDGTGGPDLAMTSANYSGGCLLTVMNTGTGSPVWDFAATRVDSGFGAVGRVVVENMDGLNRDDAVVCIPGENRVGIYPDTGAGALETYPFYGDGRLYCDAGDLDVGVADLDLDGNLDLVIAEAGSSTVSYSYNSGTTMGVRSDITTASGGSSAIAVFDFDGDGDDDVLAGGSATIQRYQNEYNIGFYPVCSQPGGYLDLSGSDRVDSNRLTLNLGGAQSGQMGYFINSWLYGASPGAPINPPGGVSGQVCIGGSTVAYGRHSRPAEIFTTDGSGAASLALDLNDIHNPRDGISWPNPGHNVTAILSGETWYWQAWYRISGGSEFSDAVGVTFR